MLATTTAELASKRACLQVQWFTAVCFQACMWWLWPLVAVTDCVRAQWLGNAGSGVFTWRWCNMQRALRAHVVHMVDVCCAALIISSVLASTRCLASINCCSRQGGHVAIALASVCQYLPQCVLVSG